MHTKENDSYIQSVIKTTSHTTLQGSTEQDHKDSVGSKHTLHKFTLHCTCNCRTYYQPAGKYLCIYVKKLHHFQEMYLAKKEKKSIMKRYETLKEIE